MSKIGFIGLGLMGVPMALNLAAGGHQVRGYTRTEASREQARKAGLEVADSLADALEGAELVITMLPDSPDVSQVITGEEGILELLSQPVTIVDMSTISPASTRDIARQVTSKGHDFLDAPVSGGDAGAREGVLSIMVGGDQEVFEKWLPVFNLMGQSIAHLGDHGAGQVTKAANQLMVAGHIQMLAEAFAFLNAQGVDPRASFGVIAGGLAGSKVIDRKLDSVLSGDFEPGFRSELHLKDLKIVANESDELGISLPATALIKSFFQLLVANDLGKKDHSALVKLIGDLNSGGK